MSDSLHDVDKLRNHVTVVFGNGYNISFRSRDSTTPRFKVYSSFVLEKFKEHHPNIHYDDCSGEELATIIHFIMHM